MPNDKSGYLARAQGRILTNLILSMLPLLSFQRNTLPIIRTSLQRDKDDYIKAIGNFVSLELHALMMILDPAHKLRGRLYDNLERDLTAELTQILEKCAASLVSFVEIQEMILSRLIDTLQETKNGKYDNTRGA